MWKLLLLTAVYTVSSESLCDSTWTYFEKTDSCYKGFFHATWKEAEARCQSYGAHLTSIHSNAENDFVFDLVTMGTDDAGKYDMTWIGLHRNPPGSYNFEFVDGTEFDPYLFNKWAPWEPSNNLENCVQLISDYIKSNIDYLKHWNDIDCTARNRRFVCKKPAYDD